VHVGKDIKNFGETFNFTPQFGNKFPTKMGSNS
jgi:hypothetical protein